jgi:hypothetical protein
MPPKKKIVKTKAERLAERKAKELELQRLEELERQKLDEIAEIRRQEAIELQNYNNKLRLLEIQRLNDEIKKQEIISQQIMLDLDRV